MSILVTDSPCASIQPDSYRHKADIHFCTCNGHKVVGETKRAQNTAALSPMLMRPTLVAPLVVARGSQLATAEMNAAAAVITKSFGTEAVAFFNNMRVPAALIAAAAIKDAFVMQSPPEDLRKSTAWRLLRNFYLIMMMLAFTSELTCVFLSTHAIAALQMTPINLRAVTLGELLVRELEYEYVGVRTGFTTGLLAFTVAQAMRVRYALRKSRELSWCAMWFVLSAASSLLTYNNAKTLTYGGYSGLLSRWFTLHTKLVFTRIGFTKPMATFSVFSLFAATAVGTRILLRELMNRADSDGDGQLSAQEIGSFARSAPLELISYIRELRSLWFKPQSDGESKAGEQGAP